MPRNVGTADTMQIHLIWSIVVSKQLWPSIYGPGTPGLHNKPLFIYAHVVIVRICLVLYCIKLPKVKNIARYRIGPALQHVTGMPHYCTVLL